MSGNEQVRVEIQTFLLALASYADRVAHDPKITFEEHHVSLMMATPLIAAAENNTSRTH